MTDQGNNNQNISRNPFAALFSSLADAKQFASGQKPPSHHGEPPCELTLLRRSYKACSLLLQQSSNTHDLTNRLHDMILIS